MPLHTKLSLVYTIAVGTLVLVAALVYAMISAATIRSYSESEALDFAQAVGASLSTGIELENRNALRARSESVAAVASALESQATQGTMHTAQAMQRTIDFVAAHSDDYEYFFIIDSTGRLIYRPGNDVFQSGADVDSMVDRVLTQKRGYICFYAQLPGDGRPNGMCASISQVPEWGWYVVAIGEAAGSLESVPTDTLTSLLNGFRQKNLVATVIRDDRGTVDAASNRWSSVEASVTSVAAWDEDRLTDRVVLIDRHLITAFTPLHDFSAEVGVVFSSAVLEELDSRLVFILIIGIAAGIATVTVASRFASRFVTRPVLELSDRLNRRLGSQVATRERPTDLRDVVLRQLRALVRLDYERRGRVAAEQEATLAQLVFENTTEGIAIADAQGILLRVNPALLAMTGYTAEELIGRDALVLRSPRNSASFCDELQHALGDGGTWAGEVWNRRKDGTDFPQLLSVRAVKDDDDHINGRYIAVCHDISERKEAENRLHHLATHDALTGLPNRTYLTNVLDHMISHSRRSESLIAVLFLDVDNFKDVNDSYGHETGDQLLTWIARRLESQVRDEDIVVRFGGDEFVIILPEIQDAEYASVVARRILAAARESYLLGPQKIRPSVSIGIAIYPEAQREESDILRDADAAMYAAKRSGRNTYRFHNPGMNETAHHRVAMQSSVATAIDAGEFVVAYQPILSLSDSRIAGAEALVRWHRDGHVVMPGDFLEFVENSSMQIRLDLWVLDQVCLDMNAATADFGDDFRISVNAGAYNLIQDDFVHRVTETVARNGVDPTRIAIEVTESAAIRNFDRARATLRELQAAGFKLYLDDFGEGYSSIRYLREFGVDIVKLDRAYVVDVEQLESSRSLVSGFTQLAHGMRLEAVIEGVETRGQLDFIRSVGCDYAQGFLVGEAMDLRAALSAKIPE